MFSTNGPEALVNPVPSAHPSNWIVVSWKMPVALADWNAPLPMAPRAAKSDPTGMLTPRLLSDAVLVSTILPAASVQFSWSWLVERFAPAQLNMPEPVRVKLPPVRPGILVNAQENKPDALMVVSRGVAMTAGL